MKKHTVQRASVLLMVAAVGFSMADEKQEAGPSVALSLAAECATLAEMKTTELAKFKAQALDKSMDRDKRGLAILLIAELGSKDAADFLATVWERPLGVLDHERLCLIDWCGEHCGAYSIPMLTRALKQEWRDERWHAARELARIQGPAAMPTLKRLAHNDPDGIVRSQVQEYMNALAEQTKADIGKGEQEAVVRAIIGWSRTSASGPYVKASVIYLLRNGHPANLEDETIRLYSMAELKLLGKMLESYSIQEVTITGTRATALLKYAVDPPADPVPFPFSGWRLTLIKAEGRWSVTEAVRQTHEKE